MIAAVAPVDTAGRSRPWREKWREAGGGSAALRAVALYLAVRVWGMVINCFPIDLNLKTARMMGRFWWLIMRRHRDIAMSNLRPSLGHRFSEDQLRGIARRSFEHFAQLYLVELAMVPRLINQWSWSRYVTLGDLRPALRHLIGGDGVIMVTPHFGNFELLGWVMARLGIPVHAVMRPLDNPFLNDFLVSTRADSGLALILKKGAAEATQTVLEAGGAVGFIADQDAGRKGIFVPFFGRDASWYKSIGLLAMHRGAPILVGHAARETSGFHYRIEVDRIIEPREWADCPDPLRWITREFASAMEAAIGRHPEQYLWMHRRWKSRPRGEGESPAGQAA